MLIFRETINIMNNTHIINNNGSYVSKFYTLKGNKYEVRGSKSTGHLAIQSIDTIKNIETGKVKEIERKKLYSITRNEKS